MMGATCASAAPGATLTMKMIHVARAIAASCLVMFRMLGDGSAQWSWTSVRLALKPDSSALRTRLGQLTRCIAQLELRELNAVQSSHAVDALVMEASFGIPC